MSGVIDVAVVGAGPAGLAATLAAGELGCEVTLIDAGSGVGGQMYRPGMLVPGSGQASYTVERLPPRLARVRRSGTGRHLAATWAGDATRGADGVITLAVGGPEGGAETTVEVRAVVLATGAAELVLPFPGWDLPGVTTAGAAYALLASQGVTMGRRVLVAGTGPLLLPVAAALAQAGVQVAAVLEATTLESRVTTGLATTGLAQAAGLAVFPGQQTDAVEQAAILARHGVPVRTGYAVVACRGDGRVQRAVIARLDQDWRPVPGSHREEIVNAVHVSFGCSPALELPRALGCALVPPPGRATDAVACDPNQATSVPGVFAAGEVTGTGGADAAELAGYLAGTSAARHLGRLDADAYAARTQAPRARLADARRDAARLEAAYPLRPGWLRWPDPGTIACRCQDTRWGQLTEAVTAGARDLRAIGEATGAGTGRCQARVCGPALAYAVSAHLAAVPAAGSGG